MRMIAGYVFGLTVAYVVALATAQYFDTLVLRVSHLFLP